MCIYIIFVYIYVSACGLGGVNFLFGRAHVPPLWSLASAGVVTVVGVGWLVFVGTVPC